MRHFTTPPVGRPGHCRVSIVRHHHLTHDPATGAYSAEASMLGLPPGAPPPVLIAVITLSGPQLFRLVGADHTGHDIAGWRYQGRIKRRQALLLIND
jgi:hypothetical protein